MKKSKKMLFSTIAFFAGAFLVMAASGGWFTGPGANLYFSWKTGFHLFKGNYITATLEGYGNEKQVYARFGAGNGTYSDWISAKELTAEVTDYGAITSGDYEAAPFWR